MKTKELKPFTQCIGSIMIADISPSDNPNCRMVMFIDDENKRIGSNLVYPHMQGYRNVCQVDEKWISNMIAMHYGIRQKGALGFRNCKVLKNKYAIEIEKRLYYNHDGRYYLIEKPI